MAETTDSARSALDSLARCRTTLHGMKQGISAVVKARERDFLTLGEDLMAVQAGCEDLSAKARELVDLSSGQSMLATLEALSSKLRAVTGDEANASGRQSLADIDTVFRIVEELAGIVAAFAKIVKKLSMLGIATRIESARLGADGRGFSTLADDVEKLAHSIVDHCAGIAGRIESLRGLVESARERTNGSIKAQDRCHETITTELAANIAGVTALSARSAALSQDLSATATEISADVSKAVQSIQFHDIVRQQIEHVEEALKEVADMLDDTASAKEDPVDLLGFASDVLTLQTSQLDSAGGHFSEAATTLRTTLDSLAARIFGIGQAIASLTGHDGATGQNPLAGVEAGIASVKQELGDFAAQGEALGGIMDVVKRAIDALRGTVDIESEPGRGTVISVRLPLTLAIIDGLQVQVGAEYYVVPLALVEECVELPPREADDERRLVNMRGEIVPCLRLRDVFEIAGGAPNIEPVVVVRVEGTRLGIAVDHVVGEHQTVIKSLGRLYRDMEEFSGATIRGDGSMALILDVPALARRVAEVEA